MARSSGNTLGLGELGYATGHNANVSTTTSMSTVNGGTDGSPSLDDFGIDGVGTITTADDTPDEGSTTTITQNFTNAGLKFLSHIGNQTRNFTWGHVGAAGNGSYASADYQTNWTAPAVGSNTTANLSCEFNDFFNAHATNYGSIITKSVTIQETSGGSGTAGGPGSCFAIGTEVLMADGTWKRIETITIDDVIESVKIPTLPDGDSYPSYATWQGTQDAINKITLEDGTVVQNSIDYFYDFYEIIDAENNVIKATHEHPFLVKRYDGVVDVDGTDRSIYRFVQVRELLATDKLVKSDGTLLTIHSINYISQEDQFVNINIEVNDCYMVRWGDNSFIVHNKVTECIHESILVDTPDGPKSIHDLNIGDLICTYNFEKDAPENMPIVGMIKPMHDNLIKVNNLILTDDHPIIGPGNTLLSLESNHRVETDKLKIGSSCQTLSNGFVSVESIEQYEGTHLTYTLLNENNNFFAGGVLVHSEVEL